MHQYWIEECRFEIQEQHLACQVGSILKTKKLSEVEIHWVNRVNRKSDRQGQPEERGAQEILVEQGHDNEQQQKTYHVYSFPEDDEILVKKTEMERYNEEEKELLMRVAKEIRCDPERSSPNLRYIDRKKVRAATMMINKIVSLIKTETTTETNSALRAAYNIDVEMVGYKNNKMTGDRQPNLRRRILGEQKVLRKELGQLNRIRPGELPNEDVISKLESSCKKKRC